MPDSESAVRDRAPRSTNGAASEKSQSGTKPRQSKRESTETESEKMSQTLDILAAAEANGWTVKKSTVNAKTRGAKWPESPDLPTAIYTFTRGDETASMAVVPHASNASDHRMVRGNRKLGSTSPVKLPDLLAVLAEKTKTARKPRKRAATKTEKTAETVAA